MTPAATENSENLIGAAPLVVAPARPSTAGMTTKVVKGSLWTLAGQIAPLTVSMVATPFTIRLLGSEGYGVLVLIGMIPNYFLFADFGMGMASTKFGSEAYAEGNPEKEARVVRTAALIATIASLPVAALLFALSSQIVGLFNVPERLQSEANLALKLAAITFFINFLNGIFNTPQLARLRMDLNTLVTSGFRMLGIIATPIVIYLGFGIAGAAAVLLAASVLTLVGHIYISSRMLPNLFGKMVDRNALSPLLKYGIALVSSGVVALFIANIDKGILPRMVSVEALAYYTVGFTLVGVIAAFTSSMNQSLIPAFSQLQADENREQFQNLYSRGIRLTLIWLIPCIVFLTLVATPFLTVWAGEEFGRRSAPLFFIFLAGLALSIPSCLPYAAVLASGRTSILAQLYLIELIPYVVLLMLFTYYFGAMGTAAAWSIKAIVETIVLFQLVRKVIGISYQGVGYSAFIPAALVMIVPLVAGFYFGAVSVAAAVSFLVSAVLYFIGIWKMVLRAEEKIWLGNKISGFTGLP